MQEYCLPDFFKNANHVMKISMVGDKSLLLKKSAYSADNLALRGLIGLWQPLYVAPAKCG
jgi:hypothetical protein